MKKRRENPKKSQGYKPVYTQKKRYKICHWGCTFSKGKLLSILSANMYILGVNMYILGANMYIYF